MTQDTRKDPRAKIVSLNVRYKSATVDEFIDNHSHDVSKGGIFIKTPSPFPPGTLLKFEIRIAGDKAVIAGVGRVVWKRETSQSNSAEQPAGMGVKFIKIDDPSRAIIDRLVDTKGGARSAYDEGGGDGSIGPPAAHEPATPATALVAKEIRKGGAPSAGGAQAPKPAPAVASRAPAPQPKPQAATARGASLGPTKAGKPTMMGLGSVAASATGGKSLSVPTPAAGRPAGDDLRRHTPHGMGVPRPGGSGRPGTPTASGNNAAMFPKTNSQGDMPPTGEQTVMKQAAELLEEALRGAGGSMEEIGQNPLFDQVSSKAKEAEALAKLKQPTAEHPGVHGPGPVDVDDLMKPIAELEEGVAAERARRSSAPPATSPPNVYVPPTTALPATSPATPPASVRPPSAVAAIEDARPKNKWLLPVLVVAAVGGIGFFAYTEMHAPPAENSAPAPPLPPSAAPSAPPSAAVPVPVPSVSAEPAATGGADATAATPDASSADAAKSAPVSATPAAPVAPAYHPPPRKPVPAPTATATAPPPPPETDETDPIPPPTPPESTHTTPAPTATTPTASAPAPAPTASTPKPSPVKAGPKPKADDDNPY